jgi:hypothetical protein
MKTNPPSLATRSTPRETESVHASGHKLLLFFLFGEVEDMTIGFGGSNNMSVGKTCDTSIASIPIKV